MKKQVNSDIHKQIDGIIDKYFLWFIPRTVKPNHVTAVRFLLIPVIYLLLVANNSGVALIVFVIAASTDFIDGAMARTRDQITDLGKIIDPIADKLLILSVLLYVGLDFLIIKILIIFIVIELISVLLEALLSVSIGRPLGANVFGKVKLILQSFGVGFLLLGVFVRNGWLVDISLYTLEAALFFAVLASLAQIKRKFRQFKKFYKKTKK